MKNIEFYHDEIIKKRYFHSIFEFAKEKGMKQKKGSTNTLDLINWLNEEYQILDKVEKKYLGNIIRPFASIVKSIEKRSRNCDEYIVINYLEDGNLNEICFPNFGIGTMYTRMNSNEEYTLEELGL